MKKYIIKIIVLFLLASLTCLKAQADAYYSTVNPLSPSFITDLETRIRSPYSRITYDNFDETNIANFASRDTTGGQKVVTCVYSGYNYVYTAPFTYYGNGGEFSREHTWCQSWMPANGSTTHQYSDQHHLFPVEQAHANGVRNNHPLGVVSAITSSFHSGKYGKNTLNQNVYEPRDIHKGDAARALLYMCVRYDGLSGYSWNFDWLNNTKLPSLSEAPQDLATLIQWHIQDPPDKWEMDRNNYVQSVQQNRNPFIDHPEWVSMINFNDLTPQSVTLASEPSDYPSSFSTHKTSSVNVTWDDADGAQVPSGYLLIGYDKDNYFIPMDGIEYSNDSDLSDGVVRVNIAYADANAYDFSGADLNQTFYFKMYSYNGNGSLRNYKIDGTVPSGNTAAPLPVELVSFSAISEGNHINLIWETATEIENYGFNIERNSNNGNWKTIGFVAGKGNSNSPKHYSYVVVVYLVGYSQYRLKQIDFDGKFEYSNVVSVQILLGEAAVLNQNYPNPFNPNTEITFQIPSAGKVTLRVFNTIGTEVATLCDEYKDAGVYRSTFSASKNIVASGVYYYQLRFGARIITRKMLFVK